MYEYDTHLPISRVSARHRNYFFSSSTLTWNTPHRIVFPISLQCIKKKVWFTIQLQLGLSKIPHKYFQCSSIYETLFTGLYLCKRTFLMLPLDYVPSCIYYVWKFFIYKFNYIVTRSRFLSLSLSLFCGPTCNLVLQQNHSLSEIEGKRDNTKIKTFCSFMFYQKSK